jgi:hypothetical protein
LPPRQQLDPPHPAASEPTILETIMANTRSAAAPGLPTNIIPFPMRGPVNADFEPDVKKHSQAFIALSVSWQFAHLDAAGIDRAIEEMGRMNRHGAIRMVRENAEAIRWLYEATDFLIEADTRMQEALSRVITKLEAN